MKFGEIVAEMGIWDSWIVPALAILGAALSVWNAAHTYIREKRDRENSSKELSSEIGQILIDIDELRPKVNFLDMMIWEHNRFTRSSEVLGGLAAIKQFWRRNEGTLRRILGGDSHSFQIFHGLYQVALENEDNTTPANGEGTWRGITQANLKGAKCGQVLDAASAELKNKRPTRF